MKSHKLLLLFTLLAVLPWTQAGAQPAQSTLIAQAAPPTMPMPTADEKTAPANAIGKPIPDASSKAGSSPRQEDPGADTRPQGEGKPGDTRRAPDGEKAGVPGASSPTPGGKPGTPGGKTGAPDNAGMPGSGATSGSGGSADPR